MAARTPLLATCTALMALALAPAAFSLHLQSFLHAKELVYAAAAFLLGLCAFDLRVPSPPRWLIALLVWLVLMALIALGLGNHFLAPLAKLAHGALVLGFAGLAFAFITAAQARAALLLGAVLAGGLGLLQFFHVTDAVLPVFPHYDQRMYSVFGNQDLLGGYMAIFLPFAAALALDCAPRARWCGFLALAVLGGALLLSESRSAWLAAGLGGAVYACLCLARETDAARRGRVWRLLAAGAVTVAATVYWWAPRALETFSSTDTGGNLRLWFYAGTRHMISGQPWLGVGLGAYGHRSPFHMGAVAGGAGGERYMTNELHVDHAHSDPLELLAETGALGLALLGGLLWISLRGTRLDRAAMPELASLVALGAFACLNPTLQSAPHAVAGLFAVRALFPGHLSPTPTRAGRAVHLLGPLAAAVWLYLVFAPSWVISREEDALRGNVSTWPLGLRQPACAQAEALAARAERMPGLMMAPDRALVLACGCAEDDPGRAAGPAVHGLVEEALRVSDTGHARVLAARYFRALGDTARAEQHERAVLERWPWRAAGR